MKIIFIPYPYSKIYHFDPDQDMKKTEKPNSFFFWQWQTESVNIFFLKNNNPQKCCSKFMNLKGRKLKMQFNDVSKFNFFSTIPKVLLQLNAKLNIANLWLGFEIFEHFFCFVFPWNFWMNIRERVFIFANLNGFIWAWNFYFIFANN